MMLCGSFCLNLRDRIQPWLRDYDALQSFAVILIYIQVGSFFSFFNQLLPHWNFLLII